MSMELDSAPTVSVITPCNYPLAMPMLDVPAALIAGCAVLLVFIRSAREAGNGAAKWNFEELGLSVTKQERR
jgi:Aldehyde dehydrogenase family